ncbi:putative galactose-1-phosphate uridyl transferase, C-terminal domain protein [[Clostridium] sordellii ATCC 9714]|nr:putative galactose-1-phosphate uridyl transferase, C-terminal domain protein [[Clostridium] sordellii ATCC 9714] [Paeniclostridium sordellii ATCC 9714]
MPARLKEELEIIKKCLLKEKNEEYILKNLNLHLEWFNYLKKKYGDFNKETIDDILKDEVGLIFKKVLEDCGVFKFDEEGLKARNRYIQNLKKYLGV